MDGYLAMVDQLEDSRRGNTIRFSLAELLNAAFAAMLCGAQSCVDMEDFTRSKLRLLRKRLPYEHGAPSHDRFTRLFGSLDS